MLPFNVNLHVAQLSNRHAALALGIALGLVIPLYEFTTVSRVVLWVLLPTVFLLLFWAIAMVVRCMQSVRSNLDASSMPSDKAKQKWGESRKGSDEIDARHRYSADRLVSDVATNNF